jgi:hypothetical protein
MIGGDFRPDDLTHLFLYARDRCDGRESVQEIGDFVAHHAERNKGIVTRATREWFAIATFSAWCFRPGNRDMDGNNLPAITPRYLNATLKRLDGSSIRRNCGLSKSHAQKLLPGLIAKFRKNESGTFAITKDHTERELDLVRCLCSLIVVKCAFDGTRLFEDFCSTLRGNGLISQKEIAASPQLKSAVQLFAVAVMHNCAVRMDDGSTVTLRAADVDSHVSVLAQLKPQSRPLRPPRSFQQISTRRLVANRILLPRQFGIWS